MKFEMEIGYIQNEKITVETWDFDKIEIIKDFIDWHAKLVQWVKLLNLVLEGANANNQFPLTEQL